MRTFRMTVAIVLSCMVTPACFTQANLPDRVTVENIRRIQLGMTRQDVEAILGPPLKVEHFSYAPETLVYFTRLWTPMHYPMLWVHLRDDGRVVEVYAKRHNSLDSDGVYVLRQGPTAWEKPNDFLNTFPHQP